uniref:C1q domain-containing protein n=1 Tax=Sparus aurata TaxID=8175 RepID=A0A671V4N7_SPAAU
MEMTMRFPLLLLICSLCTAQLQTESDNHIIPLGGETEAVRREPTNTTDQPQGCKQDIHAVLREMSASLAEQRVEMRHLQRENEAQAEKLNKLELQTTELEKQKTELKLQKTEVDKLKQELQAQTAELISIKARTNVTENQVEVLKRDGEVKQVAFSASLFTSGSGTLGPFNTHTPLVFRHVVTNIGNAYNPNTGTQSHKIKSFI